MDAKIEGYLVAATALIPAGIMLATNATGPAWYTQLIGISMIFLGLVAIGIRSNMKEVRVKEYVEKKINEGK